VKQGSTSESTVPRLRDRMREATLQALLSAAERTLAEEGLHAAKIEKIAARAGVAVGTVYNYYSDRDHLLAALLEERKAEARVAMDAVLAAHAGEPWRRRLEAFVDVLLGTFEAHRGFFAVIFQGEWIPPRDARADGRRNAHTMPEIYDRLDKLMRAGVKARVLRSDDVKLYPAMLLGMCKGLMLRSLLERKGQPFTDFNKPIVRAFLHGVEARTR
jgi:AcrR family transcriptional regulator